MPLIIRHTSSPNFEERRDNKIPRMIILHYTGLDADTSRRVLTSPIPLSGQGSTVSAHYLVNEDGVIEQLVDEQYRAWHAGAGYWRGETDINSVSIGIEIVNMGINAGNPDFDHRQVQTTIKLCQDILERTPSIDPRMVIGHSDTAPLRKVDPGPAFPWEELATNGVGIIVGLNEAKQDLVENGVPDDTELDKLLTTIGYDPSRPLLTRMQAFTMHYDRHNIRSIIGMDRIPDLTRCTARLIAQHVSDAKSSG